MSIPFTEYVRPNGATRRELIQRSPEIEQLAKFVLAAGGRFEIEVLGTGRILLEVVCEMTVDGENESWAHVICAHEAQVPEAVDRVVREAYELVAAF